MVALVPGVHRNHPGKRWEPGRAGCRSGGTVTWVPWGPRCCVGSLGVTSGLPQDRHRRDAALEGWWHRPPPPPGAHRGMRRACAGRVAWRGAVTAVPGVSQGQSGRGQGRCRRRRGRAAPPGATGALPGISPGMPGVVTDGVCCSGIGGRDPRCFLRSPGVTARVFSAGTGRRLRYRGDSPGARCFPCRSPWGGWPLSRRSRGSRWGLWPTRGSLVATKALPSRGPSPLRPAGVSPGHPAGRGQGRHWAHWESRVACWGDWGDMGGH